MGVDMLMACDMDMLIETGVGVDMLMTLNSPYHISNLSVRLNSVQQKSGINTTKCVY